MLCWYQMAAKFYRLSICTIIDILCPYWEKKEKKNSEYQNIWHNIRKVCVLLTCWTATPPASQQSSCLQVKTSPRFTQSGFLIGRSLFFGFLAFSFSLFSSATVLILWISSELASFVSSARPIAGVWCSAVKRRALLWLKRGMPFSLKQDSSPLKWFWSCFF